MSADLVFRARVADLLHLLSHAEIKTPLAGEQAMIETAIADVRRMLDIPEPAGPEDQAIYDEIATNYFRDRK